MAGGAGAAATAPTASPAVGVARSADRSTASGGYDAERVDGDRRRGDDGGYGDGGYADEN